MFTLFDFGLELVKIAILAAAYSLIIYCFTFLYAEINKRKLKRLKLISIYGAAYLLVLIFSFTYYGDHGLGDEANLPLGHFTAMNSGDGYAYFESGKPEGQISVDSFLVKDDRRCIALNGVFFVYHLRSGDIKRFGDQRSYDEYVTAHNLPPANELQKFWDQYDAYWNGWRFWLLP